MQQEIREILGYCRLDGDPVKRCRGLRAIKTFLTGEVALREKPFLTSTSGSDFERLLLYCKLDDKKKRDFLEKVIIQVDLKTWSVYDIDQAILEKVASKLVGLGIQIDTPEVLQVLERWELSKRVHPHNIYAIASTMNHSCDCIFDFTEDKNGCGVVVARDMTKPQRWVGIWMLKDFDIWWKGADVRSEALLDARLLGPDMLECLCERCQGDDTCRAIRCPGCADYHKRVKAARCLMWVTESAVIMACFVGWARQAFKGGKIGMQGQGELHRNGKLKCWRCNVCDFNASDTAVEGYIKIEQQLIQDLEDLPNIPTSKLKEFADCVESRIGNQHWLAASIDFEMYDRQVSIAGPGYDFLAVRSTLRIAEWIISRKLPPPPRPVAEKLVEMMFETLNLLQGQMCGVRDFRVCYVRAADLIRNLLEYIDKRTLDRFKSFGGLAQNLKRRCGFCQKFINFDAVAIEPESISADDFGNTPTTCSTCGIITYCSTSCQVSDARRHKKHCIPWNADLATKVVSLILVPP